MKKLLAVIFCLLLLFAAACGNGASDEPILTVSGEGISEPMEFSLKDLQTLDDQTLVYSTVNNFPSTKYAKAQGCSLAALLEACGAALDGDLAGTQQGLGDAGQRGADGIRE